MKKKLIYALFLGTLAVTGLSFNSCSGNSSGEGKNTEETTDAEEEKEDLFVSKDGQFKANFPGDPQRDAQMVATEAGDIEMISFVYEKSATEASMIAYSDYPSSLIDGQDPMTILGNARDGSLDVHRSSQTGQTYRHPPHCRQRSDFMSNGVPMLRDWPLPLNPIAPPIICSAHILTQRPQRIQVSCSCLNRCRRTSYLEARSWIVFDSGHDARSNSITMARARMTRLELVLTTNPSSAGYVHEVTSRALGPSPISTTHNRQAPYGVSPSMWQSVGTERPCRRMQESSVSSGRASSLRLLTSM